MIASEGLGRLPVGQLALFATDARADRRIMKMGTLVLLNGAAIMLISYSALGKFA